ncbi:cytochrome c5 [Streptomyces sp. SAI-144]|jgi:hypothetical protein|uniref:hypothetical protein n=1 Tax=Streptomyces sp. SAI-144 TaxID=2940544 RepID=UPI0024743869|nr:hypothetical protein [Streptomyces sp. SAI-144]MDH6435595.1 cytochrome c5 [Streptomyces sp. SAI-144]
MRTRTALPAVLLAVAAVTAACGKSEAEQQADCQKALTSSSTKTSRPEACKDLSQDDYETLLMAYALQQGINDMPTEDQQLLDMSDDGELNGSISGD